MQIISYPEARNNLKPILESTVGNADITVVSRRDSEDAIVMSLDCYNSLIETVHLLRPPANAARLVQSIKEYQQGETMKRALIDE